MPASTPDPFLGDDRAMDDAELLARMGASMSVWVRLMPVRSPGGSVIDLPGVAGSVVPALPQRSVVNSVVYEDRHAFAAAVEQLAETYAAAGVAAWTVWVPPGDEHTGPLLERAGHNLDGVPTAMGMELAAFEPVATDVDVDREPDPVDLAEVLVPAYGGGDAAGYLAAFPSYATEVNWYLARVEDKPAACVATIEYRGDCGVYWVGTVPEARGRGLASALMIAALSDARDNHCTTTTLQSTKAGHPVYERLGYRDLGTIEMWERRATSAA
jgi:GNAT superfamily N-acetyltransferase